MDLKQRKLEVFGLNPRLAEAELVEGAVRGDERALEKIFRLHKDRVFSICMRMTGNFYEAEDLLQETFVRVFRKIGSFRGDSSLSTWLHRIAVNVTIESLRKRQPSTDLLADDAAEGERGSLPMPSSKIDLTLERLRLERAIAALPPGYRLALVLHDVEGYNHEEIAGFLGSCVGTSKSQLHKARRKLRDLLTAS